LWGVGYVGGVFFLMTGSLGLLSGSLRRFGRMGCEMTDGL